MSELRDERMRDRQIDPRRRMILQAGLAGIALSPGRLFAAVDAVGLVRQVQGAAFMTRGGGQSAATAGEPILENDIASTGDQPSRLQLDFRPATRIRLGANAIFQVEQFVRGLPPSVRLDRGPALIEHKPGVGPDVTVRTPYGLLAARGTTFFAGPSQGVFGVFVRQGLVDVRTAAGSVTLAAGEGTDIAAPGAPPSLPKRWANARIQAALASVS